MTREEKYFEARMAYDDAGVAYEICPDENTERIYHEKKQEFYEASFMYLLELMDENEDVLKRLKER